MSIIQDSPVTAGLSINTLKSTDVLYIARVSTGEDCYINVADFITGISSKPVQHVTCLFNVETLINVATEAQILSKAFKSIVLDCYFERNNKSRKQIIELVYTNGVVNINAGTYITIPDTELDLGITLEPDLTAGLNLKVTVDSDTNNVEMYYNVLSIISL